MQTSKTVATNDKLVVNTKQPYRPAANTAQNNAQSWATIQAALKAGPKTRGELTKLVTEAHNHAPFVGYAIRRGWLVVPASKPAPKAKATK